MIDQRRGLTAWIRGVPLVCTSVSFCLPVVASAQMAVTYPYQTEGVCPFECCQLGKWTAKSRIPVYRAQRSGGPALFTIQQGQTFVADNSVYWSVTPLIMRTKVPVELPVSRSFVPLAHDRAMISRADPSKNASMDDMVLVPAGESVYVLAYLGEGEAAGIAMGRPVELDSNMYAPMWKDRGASPYEVIAPAQIPCETTMDPVGCPTEAYVTENKTEWWVSVRVGPRNGWIQASLAGIQGADGCGN